VVALSVVLSACGGGGSDQSPDSAPSSQARSKDARGVENTGSGVSLWSEVKGFFGDLSESPGEKAGAVVHPKAVATQVDAVRLANQATFGPSEPLVSEIRNWGAERWIADQMNLRRLAFKLRPNGDKVPVWVDLPKSRYTSGGTNAVHRHTSQTVGFCDTRGDNCWRDWSSSTPLVWDFYRNAVFGRDQLRMRVSLALQQLLVISNYEVDGTYGFRNYYNTMLDHAFGNYRDLLRKVILSPVMGDYLDHVNNNRTEPNENFARELLQLFSLGTCLLNQNGTLQGGSCTPTYDNDVVRAYAFALTGWTYPPGGASPWGCWPSGSNCRFYDGDMVAVSAFHNNAARTLLSGRNLQAGNTAQVALETVLDSIMAHQNIAPFISRHLIQQLVSSNPSPAYVQRVAAAFTSGRYGSFGRGAKGDLAATVAAVLLDTEARSSAPSNTAGRLREPIQLFTGVLRGLNGRTDGDALAWWWGEELRQHVFRPPSVFNFYPPDYPVAGTSLVGPSFGIHNANTALNRVNFVNYLVFWNGSDPGTNMPTPAGTKVDLNGFTIDANNAAALVDRISLMALGEILPSASRSAVINAVNAFPSNTANDKSNRVRQAAFLVFSSPQYQVVR
jgi:Protein of unknown function (DUF1800)